MAESKKLLVLIFAAMVSSLEAYVFYAGGHDGWVVDPAESYNHWAERNRFQINDTIGTRIISLSLFVDAVINWSISPYS
jgi:hypothetical protein